MSMLALSYPRPTGSRTVIGNGAHTQWSVGWLWVLLICTLTYVGDFACQLCGVLFGQHAKHHDNIIIVITWS